jgi:hypothetical protein
VSFQARSAARPTISWPLEGPGGEMPGLWPCASSRGRAHMTERVHAIVEPSSSAHIWSSRET